MAKYAQGKYALAVSDISGQSFPWNEMVTQWNGLFVHYSEFESKQRLLQIKLAISPPKLQLIVKLAPKLLSESSRRLL